MVSFAFLDAFIKGLSRNKFYTFAPSFALDLADSVIHIFGDHVVTFNGVNIKKVQGDVTLFVMVNQKLADSYRTWFKLIWETCRPKT